MATPSPAAAAAEPVRWQLTPLQLAAAVALWLATLGNLPLWQALWRLSVLTDVPGLLFGLALLLMTTAAVLAFTSLGTWRGVLKPVLITLLLVCAASTHFMLAYGIVIDPTMMTNVLETDRHEALDLLLNARLVVLIGVLGVLPAWLVWCTPVRHARWPRQLAVNLAVLLGAVAVFIGAGVAAFQPLSSTMRNHHQLRYLINPFNTMYGLGRAVAGTRRAAQIPLQPLGRDATPGPSYTAQARAPLLVLVVGETARSDHFGLNGYARDTTPELAALAPISWRNAWSCGTNTAASLPCMFSNLGRVAFADVGARDENLLDVLQHAGLAVLWIDNQAGCKGVCERVPNVHTTAGDEAQACPDGECPDAVMLRDLGARLAALPAQPRARGVVLVLHQMGSHGPAYYKRSPPAFKRFMPECTSGMLQQCSRDEVINAYDNTIATTDHFLAATIGWLKGQPGYATALLYVSDHGESLGENNLYLHGLPYALAPDVQKHVPWITWLSPEFAQRRHLRADCLEAQRDQRVSHDHYFHSVLGLLDIRTSAYRSELDAYAACMLPRQP